MQLKKKGWGLVDEPATRKIIKTNYEVFEGFGGDMERLAFFSELEHSKSYMEDDDPSLLNLLTPEQIRSGIEKLKENNISSKPFVSSNPVANFMDVFRKRPETIDQKYLRSRA